MIPRGLRILGIFTVIVGGLGVSYSLSQQLLRYTDSRDAFVARYRELAEQSLQTVPLLERQRLGDEQGEREWARRGVDIPLGVVNLVTSFLLFAGALEALRGRHWGHGAWEWAARLSIPYTLLATVLRIVEARDVASQAEATFKPLAAMTGVTASASASFVVIAYQTVYALYGLALVTFFLISALYLRKPRIKALFPPPPPSVDEE